MKTGVIAAVFAAGFVAGLLVAAQEPRPAGLPAEQVTGIGGVFFKARDPAALGAWYREKLGVPVRDPGTWGLFEWRERQDQSRPGVTVWSLFPADTRYLAPSKAPFMINYRVRDLDRMVAQLRSLGVTVDSVGAEEFNGRFAWVMDPEGNKIELWEPKPGF